MLPRARPEMIAEVTSIKKAARGGLLSLEGNYFFMPTGRI
jgi:hypothetical protein